MRKIFLFAISLFVVSMVFSRELSAETSTSVSVTQTISGSSKNVVVRGDSVHIVSNGHDLEASRAAFLKKREELLSEFRLRFEEARKNWASKEAELKLKLQALHDLKKQEIVTNINTRIGNKNQDWVVHWNEVLSRLSGILDKIQTKATEASGTGKDVSSVTLAIGTARTAISDAQSKVTAQAGKTYTFTITSTSTLGQNISSTLNLFHSDVKTVIDAINAARQAVVASYRALVLVLGAAHTPVPTLSPSPTATPI